MRSSSRSCFSCRAVSVLFATTALLLACSADHSLGAGASEVAAPAGGAGSATAAGNAGGDGGAGMLGNDGASTGATGGSKSQGGAGAGDANGADGASQTMTTKADIPGDTALWLRGDAGFGEGKGDFTWVDQSPTNAVFLSSGCSGQGSVTSPFSGLAEVSFANDCKEDGPYYNTSTADFSDLSAGLTIFEVFEPQSSGPGLTITSDAKDGLTISFTVNINHDAKGLSTLSLRSSNGSASEYDEDIASPSTTRAHLAELRWSPPGDETHVFARLDGTSFGQDPSNKFSKLSPTLTLPPVTQTALVSLSFDPTTGVGEKGALGEVIAYSRALSDGEMAQVEAYLTRWNYGSP